MYADDVKQYAIEHGLTEDNGVDLSTEITGQLVGHLNDLGIETHGSKDMEEDLRRREDDDAIFAVDYVPLTDDEKEDVFSYLDDEHAGRGIVIGDKNIYLVDHAGNDVKRGKGGIPYGFQCVFKVAIDGLSEDVIQRFKSKIEDGSIRSQNDVDLWLKEYFKEHGSHNSDSIVAQDRRTNVDDAGLDIEAPQGESIGGRGNQYSEGDLGTDFVKTGFDGINGARYMRVNRNNPNTPEFFTVYHGTANKFSRFDHSHMGEGEGAQVYGWGTYVAVNRNTSLSYAKKLVGINGWRFDGRPLYKGYLNALKAPKILRKLLSEFNSTDEMIRELNEYANSSTISLTHVLDRIWLGVSRKEAKELANELKREWKHLSRDSRRYLYRVEIPDNIKRRFLEWHKPIGNRLTDLINGMLIGQNVYFKPDITGRDLYNSLASIFGSKKKASIFLGSIDIRGVHYYGKTDGECYVVFDENDLTIKGITEMFKTRNGEVYGYATPKGAIYLDERIIKPEHPIHEYTHLWDRVVRSKNEALWNRGVELMKQTGLWNEYLNHPEYGQRWMLLQASRPQLLRMHLTVLHSKVNTTSTKRMAEQG